MLSTSKHQLAKNLAHIMKTTSKIPFLKGKRGEGKTTFIKHIAEELKIKESDIYTLNLSAIPSEDFTGLPFNDNGHTGYTRPKFLDAKILFLDEFDRVVDRAVKSSLLSLFVDRKINGHKTNAYIITAGNGLSDEYETVGIDEAMKDRVLEVDFYYSKADKLKYFEKYNSPFYAYLESRQELLNDFSSRTIEQVFKAIDNQTPEIQEELLGLLLSYKIKEDYKKFIDNLTVSLKDVKLGKFPKDSSNNIIIIDELIAEIKNLTLKNKNEIANIKTFLQGLRAEESSVFISKIFGNSLENYSSSMLNDKKYNDIFSKIIPKSMLELLLKSDSTLKSGFDYLSKNPSVLEELDL